MLAEAKHTCDYLIVGLQTNPAIDRPDTKNKPVQSIVERYVQLNAVKFVDEIPSDPNPLINYIVTSKLLLIDNSFIYAFLNFLVLVPKLKLLSIKGIIFLQVICPLTSKLTLTLKEFSTYKYPPEIVFVFFDVIISLLELAKLGISSGLIAIRPIY